MKTGNLMRFILNADSIETHVAPGVIALDFIRSQRRLTGTKEGCREGDCGACTVLVGELVQDRMRYQPMTSCLIPMGELDGKHLVTIEGIETEELTAVQAAMVECGGTQCGYCTPGFVMSMTARLIDPGKALDSAGMGYAISGNLCRCTGYRSIRAAGEQAAHKLRGLANRSDRIAALCEASELPDYFLGIEKRLRDLRESRQTHDSPVEGAVPIAGGTNLLVEQAGTIAELPVHFITQSSPVEAVRIMDDWVTVEACMSFEAFGNDPIIQQVIPGISDYIELIASWPIRVRATLGGNLCNASPVADMTCLLLALGAEIDLMGSSGQRSQPLNDFYLGYHKLNKATDEIVSTIRFRKPSENTFINWEKVSKRRCQDIATVNSALSIEVKENRVTTAIITMGGVAATPLVLSKTSAFLQGKEISVGTVLEAVSLAQTEISPVSDARGSADYRRLLTRQLILAHFMKGFPEQLREEAVYEALR